MNDRNRVLNCTPSAHKMGFLVLCLYTTWFYHIGGTLYGQGIIADTVIYKVVSERPLIAEVLRSTEVQSASPAILFYFGGGWISGSIDHLRPQAQYLAKQGMICILVDYRTASSHGTTPFASLEDATDAMQYFYRNADEYLIDTNRIVAAGGSAGGQLAAATALCAAYSDASFIPKALILYNPVIDNGPGGYGHERIGAAYPDFSPIHNIRKGAPPTLFMLGDSDNLIPVSTGYRYKEKMDSIGSRCELLIYSNQTHGFFNPHNSKYFQETLFQSHLFLYQEGFIRNPPEISRPLLIGHAHNDYRHENPLEDALLQGFLSVEADVLYRRNRLWVGHDRTDLNDPHIKDLEQLYLKPLYHKYESGVFPFDSNQDQPFNLWIDIKYSGDSTLASLRKMIAPYHSMLQYIENGELKQGAVQLILSGDRPFTALNFDSLEYFFIDGRPGNLDDGLYSNIVMPYISENIDKIVGPVGDAFSEVQAADLRAFVFKCHEAGFKVRCWNTPDNIVAWEVLKNVGVDLINTDLLKPLRAYLFR